MKDSKRAFLRFAVPVAVAAALAVSIVARSASVDADIANGLDPVTLGLEIGNYPGGTVLAGEYFPGRPETYARATDEQIANGLDPITTGDAIGNYPGGALLAGEHLPGRESILTAERAR
jgi:hypothetical protein